MCTLRIGSALGKSLATTPPKRYCKCFLSALFIIVSFIASAQSPAYFRYGRESGLICEEIYDQRQDHLGFMWIATDRGVFRFDGYSFQPFTTAQGLTDNTVFRLYEDFRGRMWVMPFNGELCYIENDKVVAYPYNDTIEKYFQGVRIIRSMEVLENGDVRLGFLLQGMIEISSTGKLRQIAHTDPEQRTVLWAEESPNGTLLLGGELGLSRSATGYSFWFQSASVKHTADFSGTPPRPHFAAVKRSNGDVLIGLGAQVIRIDVHGDTTITPLPNEVLCIMEDSKGCIWIGTDGDGVYKYAARTSPAQNIFERYYPGEIITSVVEDREGGFWVATHHDGLLYLPYVGVRAWSFFQNDQCNELLPDEYGTVYMLWRDHGLTSVFGNEARIFPPQKNSGTFRVFCWNQDSSSILIAGSGCCYEINEQEGIYHTFCKGAFNCIACCANKTYMGASWNLHCSNDHGATSYVVGDPAIRHRPDVLLNDSKGTLWVGALDGLYRVQDSSLVPMTSQHNLFSRRIAGMCELDDSTLVIATQSNGIAFMRNGKIRTLTQADGFQCDHINGVSVGKNNTVWCTTTDGLFEINARNDSISFRNFLALKPLLLSIGKPCYSRSDGRLWLGDGNRVIALQPDSISGSTISPPIYIRSVQVGDSLFAATDSIRLNHDQNSLRVRFCGLAYRLQGNVNYRYRLRGSADEWQSTRQNTVEFAALEPGEYVFEVQAQNESGLWSATPATFSLIIVPPFWATWWFRALMIVTIVTLSYVMILWRFRSIRRRDLLREQALIFRQQALASQMNPHFLFNALNTIQSLVLKEEKTKALDMFNSFATLLRKSLEHSVERYIPLEEELRMLQLYFELEEMRFEGNLEYNVILGNDIEPQFINVPAMLVQPMVENALLHGIRRRDSGGKVEVRFYFRSRQLICEIDDNGLGRKASAAAKRDRKSVGTGITRDRLRVLGQMNKEEYAFEIIDKENPKSGEATGTTVRMTMPYTISKSPTHEKTFSNYR